MLFNDLPSRIGLLSETIVDVLILKEIADKNLRCRLNGRKFTDSIKRKTF